jgi:head-tail adaptor
MLSRSSGFLFAWLETKEDPREDAGAIISSWYVFHSLHAGQRPIHFADSAPQF